MYAFQSDWYNITCYLFVLLYIYHMQNTHLIVPGLITVWQDILAAWLQKAKTTIIVKWANI